MNISNFCSVVQKSKRTFWLALFLAHPLYFSGIFAVTKEVIVIKDEPEEAPVIKTEPEESTPIKDEPQENTPLIPNQNIYDKLWEHAQKDEGLFELQEIINQYSIDLHKKNPQGKTLLHIAVENRAPSIVEYLLLPDPKRRRTSLTQHTRNTLRIDLEAQDNLGLTALQYGLLRGYLDISQKLIDAGAALNQPTANEKSLLHWAATRKVIDKPVWVFLIQKYKDAGLLDLMINQKDQNGFTPLMQAVFDKNKKAGQALIAANASLSGFNNLNQNILHFVALNKQIKLNKIFIQHLLAALKKKGFTIDQMDNNGHTPLMLALCDNNHQALASILIELGAKLDLPIPNVGNILHWAALKLKDQKNMNTFQFLIEKCKALELINQTNVINQTNAGENTPLMQAILSSNLTGIAALINGGAALNLWIGNIGGILHWAALNISDATTLRFLIEKCYQAHLDIHQANEQGHTPFTIALVNNKQVAANIFLSVGIQSTQSIHKGTILHWLAIFVRNKTALQKFITQYKQGNQNFNINEINQEGKTPLALAILNGNQAAVEVFMELRATVNLPAGNPFTLSEWVAMNSKHKNIVQHIITAESKKTPNFNINAFNQRGATLLADAIVNANQAAIEALIEAGATLEIVTNKKHSALHIAAIYVKDKTFFPFLLKKFEEAKFTIHEVIHALDDYGDMPLSYAVQHANQAAVEALIDAGATLEIVTNKKHSALHTAAICVKDKTFFPFLLKKFEEAKFTIHEVIHAVDETGAMPLELAVRKANRAAVEALIEAGAQLNTVADKKRNALHVAAAYVKDKTFFPFLLTKFEEAKFTIHEVIYALDKTGAMPLGRAVQAGNQAAVEALIEAGAKLDIGIVPNAKQNALHIAAAFVKDKTFFPFLLKKFEEAKFTIHEVIHALDEGGVMPLGRAVQYANQVAVEALLEAGAKLDMVDNKKLKALHVAAIHVKDNDAFFQFLITKFKEANIGIDELDQDNFTPLGYAIEHNNQIAQKALLGAGATKNITIKYNRPGLP